MLGIFLDTETTGLHGTRHVPIEIAFVVIDLRTGKELKRFQSYIACSEKEWGLRDLGAYVVNEISYEQLRTAQSRTEVGTEIIQILSQLGIKRGNALFICQNPSFDRVFFSQLIESETQEKLSWPYHWLDLASMYWVRAVREFVTPEEVDRGFLVSKDACANRLKLPAESKPHRALNGVLHLLECYTKLVGFKP